MIAMLILATLLAACTTVTPLSSQRPVRNIGGPGPWQVVGVIEITDQHGNLRRVRSARAPDGAVMPVPIWGE